MRGNGLRKALVLAVGTPLALSLALACIPASPSLADWPTKADCASAGLKNCAALTAFVKELRAAVAAGDKQAVAAKVAYPIEVQLGDGLNVAGPADFVRQYDTIMTPAVRDAILKEDPFVSPRKLIQMVGEKAQVWLDVDKGRLLIGTIIIE